MPRSFAARLIAWQRAHGRRDLPWQSTRDPYRIWLSEIMLQQTQVATVIPYYERFLGAFPDVASLASAPMDRVLELWAGLGYYRRAHLLHRAACTIVSRHDGQFPLEVASLAGLPGVGRSTAAAIAVFAFSARAAILDGNVKRVLARHANIAGFPGQATVRRALWAQAEALLPEKGIRSYTQALMDLGATVCLRRRPRCAACPIAGDCAARRNARIAELPAPPPRKTRRERAVTVLVLQWHDEVLLEKRPSSGVWAGLWSLPELATGGDAVTHCRTHFAAQVALQPPWPPIQHDLTHFRLTIYPQPCAVRAWPRRMRPGLLWLPLADVAAAALPAPIKKLLRRPADT